MFLISNTSQCLVMRADNPKKKISIYGAQYPATYIHIRLEKAKKKKMKTQIKSYFLMHTYMVNKSICVG